MVLIEWHLLLMISLKWFMVLNLTWILVFSDKKLFFFFYSHRLNVIMTSGKRLFQRERKRKTVQFWNKTPDSLVIASFSTLMELKRTSSLWTPSDESVTDHQLQQFSIPSPPSSLLPHRSPVIPSTSRSQTELPRHTHKAQLTSLAPSYKYSLAQACCHFVQNDCNRISIIKHYLW